MPNEGGPGDAPVNTRASYAYHFHFATLVAARNDLTQPPRIG